MGRGRAWAVALFSLTLMWAAFYVGPASAHHKPNHVQGGDSQAGGSEKAQGSKKTGEPDGDADSDDGTEFTEDNDTNDGDTPNNVPDEGDNEHPSGKDRSVENGNSGNQGNSESDPDDDGNGPDRANGGPDKPNGSGGNDEADQDGNNGCGNDDDFEDDNEGKCKGHKKTDPPVDPPDPPDPPNPPRNPLLGPDVKADTIIDQVLGTVEARPRFSTVAAAGETAPAPAAAPEGGAVLPFTGMSVGPLVILALAAIAAGLFALRERKTH